MISVDINEVTGSEFTTYDVTQVHLYANDGRRLDTTEMIVSFRVAYIYHDQATGDLGEPHTCFHGHSWDPTGDR